jgi:GNAT superfamily N-acetyltransferase
LVGPGHKSYDAQVRPDLRGGAFEQDLLAYGEDQTAALMRRHGIGSDRIFGDAFRGDTARIQLLEILGWEAEGERPYVLNRVEIGDAAAPALPKGFSYQAAKGIEDAEKLAEVHNASFGSSWTAESYSQVMASPGYAPQRELFIQAADGVLVAFTVIWYDHRNATGLFEPVGTHKEYRRRGFGRALMLLGMQRMAAAGMKLATVAHFGQNDAARRLYQSCGFKPWHFLDSYVKYL